MSDVSERIGVSTYSLYNWIRAARPGKAEADELAKTRLEVRKLKAENRRLQQ